MTDQQGRGVAQLAGADHRLGVVAHRQPGRILAGGVAGQVGGEDSMARGLERLAEALEGPAAAEGPVDHDDRGRGRDGSRSCHRYSIAGVRARWAKVFALSPTKRAPTFESTAQTDQVTPFRSRPPRSPG